MQLPPFFLPIYFLVYFALAFVWSSWRVYRKNGRSPLVFKNNDHAHDLIGSYFKTTLLLLFVFVWTYALRPDWFAAQGVFTYLNKPWIALVGALLLIKALVITLLAQYQMANAWRIGIDTENPTPLIQNGLFAHSRNPIFTAMLAALWGLFMVVPHGFSLGLFIFAYVLIQLQIRLEEAWLEQQHGDLYRQYRHKTARFWTFKKTR